MTTTHEETSLPAVISTEAITAARDHSITQIKHGLNAAWNLIQMLPEELRAQAEQALTVAWDNAQIMAGQWTETQDLLVRTADLIQAQQIALEAVTRQRAQAVQELEALVLAIKSEDMHHPTIMNFYNQMYENVMGNHLAAFWESLPYDIAETMGGEWEHVDADMLYDLITNEDLGDEGIAAEYGTTPEKVQEARAKLLAVIREFDQSREDQ